MYGSLVFISYGGGDGGVYMQVFSLFLCGGLVAWVFNLFRALWYCVCGGL